MRASFETRVTCLHIDALDAPVDLRSQPWGRRVGDVLTIGGSGFSPNGAVVIEISGMATLEVEPTTATPTAW